MLAESKQIGVFTEDALIHNNPKTMSFTAGSGTAFSRGELVSVNAVGAITKIAATALTDGSLLGIVSVDTDGTLERNLPVYVSGEFVTSEINFGGVDAMTTKVSLAKQAIYLVKFSDRDPD